jgi:hypothetical protein
MCRVRRIPDNMRVRSFDKSDGKYDQDVRRLHCCYDAFDTPVKSNYNFYIDRQRSRHYFGALRGEIEGLPGSWYDEPSSTLVLIPVTWRFITWLVAMMTLEA